MAKTTKRSKKFVARGGVKSMLAKGTVTKKGKLKGRRGGGGGGSSGGENKRQRQDRDRHHAGEDGGEDDAGGHDGGGGGAHHRGERAGAGADAGTGKRRRRGTRAGGGDDDDADDDADDERDFVASADEQARLGGLDMESFFRTAVDAATDGGGDEDDGASDGEEELVSSSDDEEESGDEHESDGSSELDEDGKEPSGSEDHDDDDDDDDDDDVERAERRMRRQMQKLSSQDPEFHKFLDENERSLLEFGDEISDDDDEQDSVSGDDDGSAESGTDEADEKEAKAKGRKRRDKTDGEGLPNSNKKDEDRGTKKQDKVREKGGKDTTGTSRQRKGSDGSANDNNRRSGQVHLTVSVLKSYEKNAFSEKHGSIKGLRRFVSAYRTACHLADSSAGKPGDESAAVKGGGGGKYKIDSAAAFDRLMVTALRRCHEAFRRHLLGESGDGAGGASKKDSEPGDGGDAEVDQDQRAASPKVLARSPHWNAVCPILNTFLKSTLHILSGAKEPKLVAFILRQLARYAVFLAPFPRVARGLLKTCTDLWSAAVDDVDSSGSREDYQAVRLQAFLRIRQMAVSQPYPFVEDCLKQTYLSYARVAKFSSEATLPTLTFMGNCVVELYSLDVDSSYQHAFVYIRQLALHLRSALQKRTKEATQVVYCWQFVNCLRVWTAVLCANPAEEDGLRSLVYPLVEIILGTARLLPTTRYLPLRFHCVRLLHQLAAATELFVPTTSVLLDALDSKELSMKPKRPKKKGSSSSSPSAAGTRLHLILRLPKDDPLRTMEQLDACVNELFLLFNREVELYRYSPGFPEFSVRICQRLRKFAKETKVGRWRAFAKGCIELCQNYSAFAIEKRALLNEAPKDVKRLEMLKPQDAPNMKTRHERALSKERRIDATSQPALSKTSEEKELSAKSARSVKDKSKSPTQKKKAERKKKHNELTDTNLSNVDVLKEEDEVQEGIEWSDAESD